MSRLSHRLSVLLLAALSLCAAHGLAQASLVDVVEGENPLGSLAVVGPLERPVSIAPGEKAAPIPGLSTAVHCREGDTLEITVSGEAFGSGEVNMYVLVDGLLLAQPGFVRLRHYPETYGQTRTFTFVHPGVSAGRHVVEARWQHLSGAAVQMRDRALTVQSAGKDSGDARLAVAFESKGVAGRVYDWTPVPGLQTTLSTDVKSQLTVTFSAELAADSGRFRARAVVDGSVLQEVVMVEGMPIGVHSFTFVLPKLEAGIHDVRIEYHGDGGHLRLWGCTLSAFAAPLYLKPAGGMSAGVVEGAPATIASSTYVELPSASTLFWSASDPSSAIVSVGAEVRVSGPGRVFLRPVVDDRYAQPGDVEWVRGYNSWRSASFSFAFKNLKPGLHKFRLEVAVDPGSTAEIGDVFWRLLHKRRSGSEFAQPLLHPSYTYTQAPKAHVRMRPLVICFDPLRPAHPAPTRVQLENWRLGEDGGASVAGWFDENSAGAVRMRFPERYVGCGPGDWQTAPPGHQGDWYWQNQAWDTMFREALRSADGQVDFHGYDTNSDGHLTLDEALIELLHPQNVPDGFVRTVSVAVDGNPQPMTIEVMQLYVSADENRRREQVSVASYLLSRVVLRAEDLSGCPTPTAPGEFSRMATPALTHLDPWHKLHSAFLTPALLDIGTWATQTLDLDAVESRARCS